jgi:hypothetical protein
MLVTYELDGLLMKLGNAKADAEIVIPKPHLQRYWRLSLTEMFPAADRPVIDASLQYLWSDLCATRVRHPVPAPTR